MDFKQLLSELSEVMGAPLAPDEHGECLLELTKGPQVHLSPEGGKVVIAMKIGTISPGPGRANFFRAMLIANGRPYPRFGDFSYGKTLDQVVLTEAIPMEELNGEQLAGWIFSLVEQGEKWQEAIKAGRVP
ncbi:MAG: CesT family type III secretion system chaperone [Parachlamydiales bacterium]